MISGMTGFDHLFHQTLLSKVNVAIMAAEGESAQTAFTDYGPSEYAS
jgi:hypothetical protein